MLALLAIFTAGLCGYAQTSILCWPAAAAALMSVSMSRHYLLVRRGLDAGFDDIIHDTLLRSACNALIATGACYWLASFLRSMSGL